MLDSFLFKSTKRSKATKSRKFSTIGLRRAQSPPSPASFVSPEIVEINEKGPFGATFPEDLDRRDPSASTDRPIPLASPQIQLEFSGDSEPLTEWLPPSILSPPENRTPPKRNVSLPNGGRDLPPVASSSTARPREDTIKEEPEQREVRAYVSRGSGCLSWIRRDRWTGLQGASEYSGRCLLALSFMCDDLTGRAGLAGSQIDRLSSERRPILLT